ncbi:MAG: beta-ketoacyl synthase chain length factor [Chitinophagales bacterium]
MAVYIKSIGQIVPDSATNPEQVASGRLACIEPDYSAFFDSRTLRRISRIIKIGTASAMMALRSANVEIPDAIIVGTGFGCLEDTSLFLRKMITNKEETLNPTPFIFSTHNSIASQIALQLKCHAYNSTYSQRNFSFESALLDAFLLIQEQEANTVLVGAADELTDDSYDLMKRIGYYQPTDVAGEGASFFVLANEKNEQCFAELKTVQLFSNTETAKVIEQLKSIAAINDIDAIVVGSIPNTLNANDKAVIDALALQDRVTYYKHTCGEYATANAYAFSVANMMLHENKSLKNVLVYNQYASSNHSIILLSAC